MCEDCFGVVSEKIGALCPIEEALDTMCPFCETLNLGKEGCSVMCNCGTLLVMEAGKWKRSIFDDVDE